MKSLFKNGKWMKVVLWGFLFVCWVLTAVFLSCARDCKVRQDYLQFGPEKIVGEMAVIYEDAPSYLYTNPEAILRHNMRCLAVQAGYALLFAALTTVGFWIWWLALRKGGLGAVVAKVLLGAVVIMAFLYVAVVCVREWSLSFFALLICVLFSHRWSFKSIFTVAILIAAFAIMGYRRMELKMTARACDAFWNSAERCVSLADFTEAFGEPVVSRRHVSEEDRAWYDSLGPFVPRLWFPGMNVHGFIPQRMPDTLLLPWFDDDGNRIAFAWCVLTPRRRAFLNEEHGSP